MYKKTFNVFALCSYFCKYEELFLAKYSVNYSDKIISRKLSNEGRIQINNATNVLKK